jgi:hypothetical protein
MNAAEKRIIALREELSTLDHTIGVWQRRWTNLETLLKRHAAIYSKYDKEAQAFCMVLAWMEVLTK